MLPLPRLPGLPGRFAVALALALTLSLALTIGSAPASAATPAPVPAAAADPTQAQANVPAVAHRSAFARYRPLNDLTPVPWREANETVNRIGGWRAYAREAAAPETAVPSQAPATPPQAGPTPKPAAEHRHGR